MIDLDDQLTAYGNYLDDLPRSASVVVPPARLRRRYVALVATAGVAIVGTIAIAAITRLGGEPRTAGVAASDEWMLVPDPNGVFKVEPASVSIGFPNTVVLNSVAHTSHGWIAVGGEYQGYNSISAVWRSSDGTDWERIPHDESFGVEGFSEERPGVFPDGPSMGDVAEYDGRVVVAGLGPEGEAVLWWTDDLATWHLIDPFPEFVEGWEFRLAAGDAGFVLFTQQAGGEAVPGDPHSVVGWRSSDGVNWTHVSIEDADGAGINDVLAVDDGFVAVGVHSPTNSAAAWASADGLTWERSDIDTSDTADFGFTFIDAVTELDGLLVGFGGGLRANGTFPISWTSIDGTEWTSRPMPGQEEQSRSSAALIGTDDEFIALGFDAAPAGANLEWRSTDGMTWIPRDVDLPGPRFDAAYFGGTAVAVGGSSVWILHAN